MVSTATATAIPRHRSPGVHPAQVAGCPLAPPPVPQCPPARPLRFRAGGPSGRSPPLAPASRGPSPPRAG